MARHFALSFRPANQRNREFRKFDWCYKASRQGHLQATHNYAAFYGNGWGISLDHEYARVLFEDNCKAGYQNSCAELKKIERSIWSI